MTLGGIVILVLMLVSLIVFIYVIVKSARTFGVLHTLLLCFLFIECWVFMVVSAGVQDRRVSGVERADKAEKDAAQAISRQETLLYGNFDYENLNLEAVVPVKGMLQRMTADRGRVWRGISFVQGGPNGFQLDLTAVPDPAADELTDDANAAAPAATSESLPVDLVVYAFAEEMNEENQPIPVYYLGEYLVSQSQGGTVTLQPTLPLRPSQQSYIGNGQAATWTLYELLPLDSHEAFAAAGSQPSDELLFGRMDEQELTDLFNEMFSRIPIDEARRQEVIQRYLTDGAIPQEGEVVPPESDWVRVIVKKEFELQVDSQDEANATERGYFDFEGRSIDVRLKRGDDGTVKLTPDTKIVLLADEARRLEANGTVQIEQNFKVRPLADYQLAFTRLVVRAHQVDEAIELVERETAKLQKSNQLGLQMINFHQVENQDLNSDLENYLKEVDVLNSAIEQAENDNNELKQKINELYKSIQSRRAKLAAT